MSRVTKVSTVRHELSSKILSGLYAPGQRLASEPSLAAELKVSVGTLRQALDQLSREGLVKRIHGSGTFIRKLERPALQVNVPVEDPRKMLFLHLWGKLVEHAHRSPVKVALKRMPHDLFASNWEMQKATLRLFSDADPVGFFEVSMSDLPWLADAGLCEDLTARFARWSQAGNLYPIARRAVTHNDRIYGLPFHGSLTGLMVNRDVFDRAGLYPLDITGSVEGLVRTVERLARNPDFKYSLWVWHSRNFLMHLVRAFYDDLEVRFGTDHHQPIEREVGIELLEMLHRLRWKLRAWIPTALTAPSKTAWDELFMDFSRGATPLAVGQLLPMAAFRRYGAPEEANFDFLPFGFTRDRREFSLFNCYVWIINPRVEAGAREFLWTFLADYVQPQSEYEIDRRHAEAGLVNGRGNAFIVVPPRVPDDPEFEAKRKHLFACAEREIPFPSPAFDLFVFSAYRVLFNPEVSATQEYDFYRAMVEKGEGVNASRLLDGLVPRMNAG